jgi:NitT/TauT family transport system ATP-binding protein
MAAVEIRGLELTYEGVDRPVHALAGIDLEFERGEPVAIIGPSGCGKSTLLLAISGLVAPNAGTVAVAGEAVTGPRLKTALILQDFGLLPWKRVFQNAALGLQIRGVERGEARRRTMEALETVGIADFARAYPAELSGGMRQRLALARALALDADVLLMDEPLSALDALTREVLQRLLLELWRARRHTQLIVTHSIEEAVFLGRRIVVLTPRPATVARIVDNPQMGRPGYRASEAYYEHCAELRAILREGGAFGDVTRTGEAR